MNFIKQDNVVHKSDIENKDTFIEQIVDIQDVNMESSWTKKERIEYLKSISKDGYVKYNDIIIKLEFKTVFPKDYLEGICE